SLTISLVLHKKKLHTLAFIAARRCKPCIYGCTLKTREKPTTYFVFDFSGTPERLKRANIVLAKSMPIK
ncbi:MAG: hypothetical protein PUF47_06930, partial [Prevotella stercorea]|nr:hypothetical protein [Leyella stercorea]